MSVESLRAITAELPWVLRSQVEGYVLTVEAAKYDIFKAASIDYDERLYQQFIFLVGIQRIWSLVDSQYWILNNSLNLLRNSDARVVEIGGSEFHTNSSFYRDLSALRGNLDVLLQKEGISHLVKTKNPKELLLALRESE
jgi:hypothetical protein